MGAVWPQAGLHHTILACALLGTIAQPDSVVSIDRDNVKVDTNCRVTVPAAMVRDADGDGVIHITGSDIEVDFAGATLHGAGPDVTPDQYEGIGVVITGKDVTVRNLNVSGYKVGILATKADRLTLEDCDVSNNFQQHLGSTPEREDADDWLWPHTNDKREWVTHYGAGVCVEQSTMVTICRVKAHHGQNGIILDRVERSFIYDNDCSFLSGWGLALWRSNNNQITHNAFDFCIRGYSHGVYNRGQDSAGLLMFEQCSDNIIADNSITHGGDGIFAFSGKEALGEVPSDAAKDNPNWYHGRGNHRNIILNNDCSFAAAHGVELTFGFDNSILANRIVGNAICGVWGGYSHRSVIAGNTIESNGEAGYGLERGGVNIEHGLGNWVQANMFANNPCGVHLWWDKDEAIEKLPWAQSNTTESMRNVIYGNTFTDDALGIQLRTTKRTFIIANTYTNVEKHEDIDPFSEANVLREFDAPPLVWTPPEYEAIGHTTPVGARMALDGRDKIIMTAWGPYDWEAPLLRFVDHDDRADRYELLGAMAMPPADAIKSEGDVLVDVDGQRIVVRPKVMDTLIPYTVSLDVDGHTMSATGTLTGGSWDVIVFPSSVDPREDAERWRKDGLADEHAAHLTTDAIDFTFGNGGMGELRHLPVKLPVDHFGTIATRSLTFPPGKWRLRTTSDDGIRVWIDDKLVIDDWTWHAPKDNDYEFEVKEPTPKQLRIEHFELDGYAMLTLAIERMSE